MVESTERWLFGYTYALMSLVAIHLLTVFSNGADMRFTNPSEMILFVVSTSLGLSNQQMA
jgi:hypothetical protein